MGLNPIGHELRGEIEAYGAAIGFEAAERDRAQPPVEGARSAIAAQAAAYLFPSRRYRA
jgi:hypothetical protein